jgi:hypothetical protein
MRISMMWRRSTGLGLAALLLTSGLAWAQPQGLDVNTVKLNEAFDPGALTPGRANVRAILNDNDTNGDFLTQVLANTVTVRIEDGGTTPGADKFDVTFGLTNCQATEIGARCYDDSSGMRVTAFVKRWRNFPLVHRITLKIRDLTNAETGFGPLTGPVTLTVNHGTTVRTDGVLASDCTVKKNGASLRCNAK